MKTKKYRFFSIIIVAVFLVTLYREYDTSELQTLLTCSNTRRMQTKVVENKEYSQYLTNYAPTELGIAPEQLIYLEPALAGLPTYSLHGKNMAKEDAISDVKFLFQVLKHSYAGYLYFGDFEKWENVRNNMINQINAYPDELPVFTLQQILMSNLQFIQDGHFLINGSSIIERDIYYYNEAFKIQEDSKGFYLYLNRHKWYIESVQDDKDVKQYVKSSLDQSGHMCKYIGILSGTPYTAVTLKLNSGVEFKEIRVELKASQGKVYSQKKSSKGYNYRKINNIPVFTMNSFIGTDNLETYKKAARQAKNEEFIILDLRGNSGGQTVIPTTWFENFTGQIAKTNSVTIRLASLINNYVTKSALEMVDYESLTPHFKDLYKSEYDLSSRSENKWYVTTENKVVLPNDTKIFVLIDKNVASSAEAFVEELDTLKNVVFVGTNTSGVVFSKQSIRCTLPYSQLAVTYGDAISFGGITEGKGFEPDIWIGGNDVLERVVDFIERNEGT